MRLLITIGLSLLASGAWAQHHSFFSIDRETDLLALPSDQLTSSDVEHEAVESFATQVRHHSENSRSPVASTLNLPFGARLPGYEKVQYAYGYQIPEKTNPKRTNLPINFEITNTQRALELSLVRTTTELSSTPSLSTNSPTTSTTATARPTTPWFTSIYFPQHLDLSLSPPESEFSSATKFSATSLQPSQSLLVTSPEVVGEISLPLVTELKAEPPPIPVDTLVSPSPNLIPSPLDTHAPPNSDPLLKVVEQDLKPPPLDTFYLPPNPNPLLEVTESISENLQPDSSYLPPNPDPMFKVVEQDSKPPLLHTSYAPPNSESLLKDAGSSPEAPPPESSSLSLSPDPEFKIEEDKNEVSVPTGSYLPPDLNPKLMTIKPKAQPSPPPPTSIYLPPQEIPISEVSSSPSIHIPSAQHIPDKPIILIPISSAPIETLKDREGPHVNFKQPFLLPLGVASIRDHNNSPLHYDHSVKKISPLGVVGQHEDPEVHFDVNITPAPPLGVIGDEDHPIKFVPETKLIPPAAVIGDHIDQPIIFSRERKHPSPAGLISEHIDRPIKFSGEKAEVIPSAVIGEIKEHPLRFTGETKNPTPFAVVGEIASQKITPQYDLSDVSPYALISETEDPVIRPQAVQPALPPYGIISELTENAIQANAHIMPTVIGAIPKDNPDCIRNYECSEDEICMDGMCVNACDIAEGLCVGNAVCRARQHIPGCVCPNMFTAVTLRDSGQDRYDCMPMMMMNSNGRSSNFPLRIISDRRHLTPIAGHRQNFNSIHLPPIGVLTSESRISTGVRTSGSSFSSDNPCSPSPCGPNTRCEVSPRNIALCRCLDDFVPDGNTINGCKPQCVTDNECPDDYRCRATKCVRVCVPGACGTNAECDARNHRPVCSCPPRYEGDPYVNCRKPASPPPKPIVRAPLDPCDPSPCGTSAECRTRGDRPVCTCPLGYEGDPLSNCRRGECIENRDCPSHRVCQQLRCVDPCSGGICGTGAECTVRNHQPVCSCPTGFVGDPFTRCRRFDPQELCNPTPCGRNTNCKVRNDRAVCSCIDNYIGNPLEGCRPECVGDSECPHNLACRNNICVNPCRDACGENAYCEVRNNRAVCSCPEYYQGDPYSRCYAECTAHDDCRSYQACFQLRCVDPCEGACGTGADCKVENHKPICSCPKGYTGHPFESCRPFTKDDLCNPNPCGTGSDCTPGFDRSGNDRPVCTCPTGFIGNPLISCQRGECQEHRECRDHEACYAYTCQNPCQTDVGPVCGENADCNVKNHQPVCSCPPGYVGNPLQACRIGSSSRFSIGRTRRK